MGILEEEVLRPGCTSQSCIKHHLNLWLRREKSLGPRWMTELSPVKSRFLAPLLVIHRCTVTPFRGKKEDSLISKTDSTPKTKLCFF